MLLVNEHSPNSEKNRALYGLYGFNLGLGPLRYTHRYPSMIHRLHSYISLDTTIIFLLLLVKNYIYICMVSMYGCDIYMYIHYINVTSHLLNPIDIQ